MSLFPRHCPSLNTCLIAAVKAYSTPPILQPPSLLNEDIFRLFFIISFIFQGRLLSLSFFLCLSLCLLFECLCLAELQPFFRIHLFWQYRQHLLLYLSGQRTKAHVEIFKAAPWLQQVSPDPFWGKDVQIFERERYTVGCLRLESQLDQMRANESE